MRRPLSPKKLHRLHRRRGSLRNVGGSFYDFETRLLRYTRSEKLAGYPEHWGGRALCAWAARLAEDNRYDPAVENVEQVAAIIDRLYQRHRSSHS